MSNTSTTTPKLADAASTISSSRTTAGQIVATTGGKGRSRASSASVFWED